MRTADWHPLVPLRRLSLVRWRNVFVLSSRWISAIACRIQCQRFFISAVRSWFSVTHDCARDDFFLLRDGELTTLFSSHLPRTLKIARLRASREHFFCSIPFYAIRGASASRRRKDKTKDVLCLSYLLCVSLSLKHEKKTQVRRRHAFGRWLWDTSIAHQCNQQSRKWRVRGWWFNICMGAKDVDGFKVNLFDYRIRTSTIRGYFRLWNILKIDGSIIRKRTGSIWSELVAPTGPSR